MQNDKTRNDWLEEIRDQEYEVGFWVAEHDHASVMRKRTMILLIRERKHLDLIRKRFAEWEESRS